MKSISKIEKLKNQLNQDINNAILTLNQWDGTQEYYNQQIQPIFDNVMPRIGRAQIENKPSTEPSKLLISAITNLIIKGAFKGEFYFQNQKILQELIATDIFCHYMGYEILQECIVHNFPKTLTHSYYELIKDSPNLQYKAFSARKMGDFYMNNISVCESHCRETLKFYTQSYNWLKLLPLSQKSQQCTDEILINMVLLHDMLKEHFQAQQYAKDLSNQDLGKLLIQSSYIQQNPDKVSNQELGLIMQNKLLRTDEGKLAETGVCMALVAKYNYLDQIKSQILIDELLGEIDKIGGQNPSQYDLQQKLHYYSNIGCNKNALQLITPITKMIGMFSYDLMYIKPTHPLLIYALEDDVTNFDMAVKILGTKNDNHSLKFVSDEAWKAIAGYWLEKKNKEMVEVCLNNMSRDAQEYKTHLLKALFTQNIEQVEEVQQNVVQLQNEIVECQNDFIMTISSIIDDPKAAHAYFQAQKQKLNFNAGKINVQYQSGWQLPKDSIYLNEELQKTYFEFRGCGAYIIINDKIKNQLEPKKLEYYEKHLEFCSREWGQSGVKGLTSKKSKKLVGVEAKDSSEMRLYTDHVYYNKKLGYLFELDRYGSKEQLANYFQNKNPMDIMEVAFVEKQIQLIGEQE